MLKHNRYNKKVIQCLLSNNRINFSIYKMVRKYIKLSVVIILDLLEVCVSRIEILKINSQ